MAMLAEPRRRQRIGPNPRGQIFIDDSENVGRSMLRNMGWKDGDGLGVTHQGISEPIKPKIQQDSRGLGFDIKSNPWVTHNDKFSELLANLNAEHGSNDSSEPEMKDKVTLETSVAGNELEKKSKSSRARIHYHKSIKNKDLSKISNKDWSCIFGKSVDLDENNEKANRSNTNELNTNNEELESETEKYVNAGSMTDYFKNKMKEKLAKQSALDINLDTDHMDSNLEQPEKKKKHKNPDSDLVQEDSNLEQPLKKKKKKRRNVDEDVIQDDPSVESNSTVSIKIEVDMDEKENPSNTNELYSNNVKLEPETEKFVNAGSMTDYFKNKMKEKLAKQSAVNIKLENLDTDHMDSSLEQPEKKKKKKHKNPDSDLVQEDSNVEQPLKKKKKKRRNLDEDVIQDDPSVESNSTVSIKTEVDLDEKENPSNTNELYCNSAKLEPETEKFVNAGSMTDYFEKKMKEKLAKQSALKINLDTDHTDSNLEQPEKKKNKKHKNPEPDLIEEDSNLEQPLKKKKKKQRNLEENVIQDPVESKSTEKFVNAGSMTDYFETKMKEKLAKQTALNIKLENLDTDHMDSNLEQPEKKKKKKHKNPDSELVQEDSNVEQPPKKKKKKRRNLEEDVIQDPVESKSAESVEGESNENEETQCLNDFSPPPKLRYVLDPTTVKSVAKKYVGANILDIPGYPIRPHVNATN